MGTKTKVKARRMWANYRGDETVLFKDKSEAQFCAIGMSTTAAVVPVVVTPLDDVEELIVSACAAHYKAEVSLPKPTNGDCMRAALEAIGVLPKKRKGRK